MEHEFNPKLDVNRALEHPKTSSFTKGVFLAGLTILLLLTILTVIQTINGKHVKTPIFENIPEVENTKQPVIDNSIHINHVSGDVINGKKSVTNNK